MFIWELGKASRAGTQQMVGCLPLLLCWIYEHFPSLRRPVFDYEYIEENPRLMHWMISRSAGNQKQSLVTFRHEIDKMDPNHMIWDPYREQRSSSRPVPEESWYSGLLVCLDVMEPYYPEHALTQFGRIQTIPRSLFVHPQHDSRTSGRKYELTFSFLVNQLDNWRAHVLDMETRSTESAYMSHAHEDYLPWFYKHSHPRVHRGELLFRLPMPDKGV